VRVTGAKMADSRDGAVGLQEKTGTQMCLFFLVNVLIEH
jgi:hypothetical protein